MQNGNINFAAAGRRKLMYGNGMYNSSIDPNASGCLYPTGGDFFAFKDLIVLEKLNADNKKTIEHFFDLQIGNYKDRKGIFL